MFNRKKKGTVSGALLYIFSVLDEISARINSKNLVTAGENV